MLTPIGIDVGVMYSSVPALQHHRVHVVPDAQGRKRIPTFSLIQDQELESTNPPADGLNEMDRTYAPSFTPPPLDEQRLTILFARLKA
ncbi:hypothetical protein BO94DRAFT_590166 [Aspergillus sclerotioniger CBS 115572]|uniref:Actin-like ATPase domain-containing protein n=1 Tax=Aspergillus sclerotioniger CBS 115572 TaxID=1450535 RepID=A0A317VC83_9EURO|nr:hypothetical protein BO94DRAFT_590166 [Aspergillus sclerotioniger CBS 115572]PWY70851.1 hypothetical protein BO94DRAFT_590166 [Aspergillus sclerotioniger CBS 115572]